MRGRIESYPDYLNVRIPSYMDKIQSSLSSKERDLFKTSVGFTNNELVSRALMLYASCIEVDKNNFKKQTDFYVNLKLLASNAKDNGRKKESEVFARLADSYQVIQKSKALKDKFEPISLLLQRTSKEATANKKYDHLTSDQVRGIARNMLARLDEIKAGKTRSNSNFFKVTLVDKKRAVESLRELLQSESRQQVEDIIKTSNASTIVKHRR